MIAYSVWTPLKDRPALLPSLIYICEGLSFDTIPLVYFLVGSAYILALLRTRPFSKDELSLAKEGLGFVGAYLRSWNQ